MSAQTSKSDIAAAAVASAPAAGSYRDIHQRVRAALKEWAAEPIKRRLSEAGLIELENHIDLLDACIQTLYDHASEKEKEKKWVWLTYDVVAHATDNVFAQLHRLIEQARAESDDRIREARVLASEFPVLEVCR